METTYQYNTITEAIKAFRDKGFEHDFNLRNDQLISSKEQYEEDEFEVVSIYRYEGDTDPADEAVVYAIQSKKGLKGILVTGYGISVDASSLKILEKLTIRD